LKAPAIQVFILSYNRPDYLIQSLNSVLQQDCERFSVIVSDNSTNGETSRRIRQIEHPGLQYIRRVPSVSSLEHYATVLREASAAYFMLFHDDDLMEPGCLRILSSTLDAFPSAAAVSANAQVFWDQGGGPGRRMFRQKARYRFFSSAAELAQRYLAFEGIAPFPSYMYRRRLVEGLDLQAEEGGQTADVSFLLKILGRGEIIWVNHTVMQYRKHPGQDSQGPSLRDMRSLLRFISANTGIARSSRAMKYYRHKTWAGVLKSRFLKNGGRLENKRMRRVYRSIFRFSPLDIFLKLFAWRLRAVFRSRSSQSGTPTEP